ncbi:hypothetical protein [Actinoplanes sp. N902-109]|uniref:hypothetical protein n=1 Tax=Actinoplanes sp. (strain N902-109) TaxID=649831 RepID=UPI00350EE510
MTTTPLAPHPDAPARPTGWHRPLLVFTAAMAVLALVTLAGIAFDDRLVTGARVWIKPFKFATSLAVYAATLAWMLSLLPRRSRAAERAGLVIVASSVVEMLVIVVQAARGQASHFNATTLLNTVLFQLMAVAVVGLFGAQVVVAVVVLRARIGDRVAAAGVRLGLGLSLLGMLAAVPMLLPSAAPGIAGVTGAHSVGVLDGGPGLPVVGWSTTGGDLRVGHFVGLHALQVLPLLALMLQWLGRRRAGAWLSTERPAVRLLVVAASAYGAVTVLLTWQALRGQPLLAPDALTLGALTAILAAATAAATAILITARRTGTHRPAGTERSAGIDRLAGDASSIGANGSAATDRARTDGRAEDESRVGADGRTGTDRARTDGRAGIEGRSGIDHRARNDGRAGIDHRARNDGRAGTDRTERRRGLAGRWRESAERRRVLAGEPGEREAGAA